MLRRRAPGPSPARLWAAGVPWGRVGQSPGSKGPRAGGLLKCGRSVLPGAPTHESCLFSHAS